ncbi:MAG: hypothetical protein LVQ95_04890 [Candidatus Micrarchaeales archaeon]|nr:hypothetical protein [Candidatus Micrarchaeales archaeon]
MEEERKNALEVEEEKAKAIEESAEEESRRTVNYAHFCTVAMTQHSGCSFAN